MSRLSDRLDDLERALDRNEGDDDSSFLGRRMAFRKVLAEWGDERFDEGYAEGQRDGRAAQRKAEKAAAKEQVR